MSTQKRIGTVTHYFDKISVAAIKLESNLTAGDQIHFVGHGADYTQSVASMQIEGQNVETAKAEDEIGMKVDEKVKPGTEVYLAASEE